MGTFSKESLVELRSRIDLIEVVSPYLKLQRSGSSHKALCPFHDEKSPSFIIQNGKSHYHCFGCGAHGDAIQFLIVHLKMSFAEAVETLAERFGVILQEGGADEPRELSKSLLKEALEKACRFYQFSLLHTEEGRSALEYLYQRGIDLSFIRQFRIGFAPPRYFLETLRAQNVTDPVLKASGLLAASGREFFFDRIMIPILDATGSVIGFSGRTRSNQGPKYVNTPETPLFKKSKVLFGLSYSRKRIAKERQAIIVEGQIDALRLIHSGFDWTVAGQGTAFTEDHVKELLHLGVRKVYLALDGDGAGREAAVKIGNLFQKEGVEVYVAALEDTLDPDLVIREKGPQEWQKLLDQSADYLQFLVHHYSRQIPMNTPAGKNEIAQNILKKISEWTYPLMIQEGRLKLAKLMGMNVEPPPRTYLLSGTTRGVEVDYDGAEADLLHWLLVGPDAPAFLEIAQRNLAEEHFLYPPARALFSKVLSSKNFDLLSLAIDSENPDQQAFLTEILKKKINLERASDGFSRAVQRLLDRRWMQKGEEIKMMLYSGTLNEEKAFELAKQLAELKKLRPQVV